MELLASLVIPANFVDDALMFVLLCEQVRLTVLHEQVGDRRPGGGLDVTQRFGTIRGLVADIATMVVNRPTTGGGQVPVYLVTVEIPDAHVRAFGRRQPLLPGMTLTARIVTEKRSLLEWLFEPLFAVRNR